MPAKAELGYPRTKQFITRVSDAEQAAMDRACKSDGVTRGKYVRDLIRADLAARGETF